MDVKDLQKQLFLESFKKKRKKQNVNEEERIDWTNQIKKKFGDVYAEHEKEFNYCKYFDPDMIRSFLWDMKAVLSEMEEYADACDKGVL